MQLEEVLFGVGGWIVAMLLVFNHLRRERRSREKQEKLKRHIVGLIRAIEKQREPLNRLVAMGKVGSEMRDEAVTALRVANGAAEEVIRVDPTLRPEGFRSSATALPPEGD
jgi:hypothetical protein